MTAEKGIAAHWRYKETMNGGKEKSSKEIEDQLAWLKEFSIMTGEDGVSEECDGVYESASEGYF